MLGGNTIITNFYNVFVCETVDSDETSSQADVDTVEFRKFRYSTKVQPSIMQA